MAEKTTGISPELLILPGETIEDVLNDRDMTQAELAASTGFTKAYINSVIRGKKPISAKLAKRLEYVFDVPMSFWINLQANYDAERQEYDECHNITEEEKRVAKDDLREVVAYFADAGELPTDQTEDARILSLRKILRVSSLVNLKDVGTQGAFRMSDEAKANPYVMGAWLRICQKSWEGEPLDMEFRRDDVVSLLKELREIMHSRMENQQREIGEIRETMKKYGIQFSVVQSFEGAPVHGYISKRANGSYAMAVTLRESQESFWFSIFHELGHIYEGNVVKKVKFVDYDRDSAEERNADAFAKGQL
ncbi:MAG: HigA family addiction module antitoxin [Selenomonadaceae bacterium]|nr:HigA family addiction module antitoxin [Selenomonadaceae bacterium]